MLPILTPEDLKKADQYTIEHTPIASHLLMEKAAKKVCQYFLKDFKPTKRIHIFCGPGNNGGDGLVIARLLHEQDYAVEVYIVKSNQYSKDNRHMQKKLPGNLSLHLLQSKEDFPSIENDEFIIDALLGYGLNKTLDGLYKHLVIHLNNQKGITISVDCPSGLFIHQHTEKEAIKARHTYTFQFPKLAFLLEENSIYVGEFTILDIGIKLPTKINQLNTFNYLIFNDISKLIKPKDKYIHKGKNGHIMLIGGAFGKVGAILLAAKAAMHSGAGLTSIYSIAKANTILQSSLPEAMFMSDKSDEDYLEFFPKYEDRFTYGIGPGLGTHSITKKAFIEFLKQASSPLVLDADALNCIAEDKALEYIPANSILTPHPKEFARLFGQKENQLDTLQWAIQQAKKFAIYIIFKGAHSQIICPDGNVYFNSTGDVGMAKGGSGDVLTGIITAFLAQGYSPLESALISVYAHGLAGEFCAQKYSTIYYGPQQLIEQLATVFQKFEQAL